LKTKNSNSYGIELHRPSIKGTELLLKIIKAIIIKAAHTSWGYDESSLQTDGLDAKKEKIFVFRERGNLY